MSEMRKTCIQCGKIFNSTDSRRKYCSEKCERINNNDRRRKRYVEDSKRLKAEGTFQKTCPVCGKKFVIASWKDCSKICCSRYCNARFRELLKTDTQQPLDCKHLPQILPMKSSDNLPTKNTVTEKQHYELHIRAIKDEIGKRYRVDSWINENNPKEQLTELMQQLIRWSLNKAYFSDQEIIDIITKAYDQSLKDYEE